MSKKLFTDFKFLKMNMNNETYPFLHKLIQVVIYYIRIASETY